MKQEEYERWVRELTGLTIKQTDELMDMFLFMATHEMLFSLNKEKNEGSLQILKFGKLKYKFEGNDIVFKFNPDDVFIDLIKDVKKTKKSKIIKLIENRFSEKLKDSYGGIL